MGNCTCSPDLLFHIPWLLRRLRLNWGHRLKVAEAAPAANPNDQWIGVGNLQISMWRQTARLGEQILNLTPTEFRMLGCLAQQAGQVMSYQQLLRCAQGYEAESIEAAELVKPHIYHLRQIIEPDSSNPRYILTVRGTGYVLTTGAEKN